MISLNLQTAAILRLGLLWVSAFGALILGTPAFVSAANEPAYLSVTFRGDDRTIRTTACLEVVRLDPSDDFGGKGGALRRVIEAMQSGDPAAVLALSHTTLGRDSGRFNSQVGYYIEQFREMTFVGIKQAFEFDGLVIFFVDLVFEGSPITPPFRFAYESSGRLGFLPEIPRIASNVLLERWNAPGGGLQSGAGTFCEDDVIARASHRFPVLAAPVVERAGLPRSHLLLRGVPLAEGVDSALAVRAARVFAQIRTRIGDAEIDGFADLLTKREGASFRQRWVGVNAEDREAYRRALRAQEPFFFFDAAPLGILYTKQTDGFVEVVYLTPNENGELRWDQSARITEVDALFKKGALYEAAELEPPFSSLEIR